MKSIPKIRLPKITNLRGQSPSLPIFFEEDPQLTPGLCWERKRQERELNWLS